MEYVSFVILHYKDYSVTDTCVQSILAMEQQERIRIVVVDNDIQKKEKDRQELLQKYQENSRIKVLQIKENGGFSYANNQGYQYAREHFGKSYIVVLNNDIEFTQKDFISRLEQSYQNNQCYILGPDGYQTPNERRSRVYHKNEPPGVTLLPHYVSCRLPYAAKSREKQIGKSGKTTGKL